KNDILWKGVLEEVFDDMLQFIFPHANKELDLQQGVEFLDKELSEMYPEPGKASSTRFVDKLVKVFTQEGEEQWMLVHVEVQGWNDPQFPKRMFTYYYRILDRYARPVTAIAIFSGADGKKMSNKFEDHCLGTHIYYQYNTLCLADYDDQALASDKNPFAL